MELPLGLWKLRGLRIECGDFHFRISGELQSSCGQLDEVVTPSGKEKLEVSN